MSEILNNFIHIDRYLFDFISQYGIWMYLILFAVIFSETGFIVTPFLPGDSLLFALGSLSAQPDCVLDVFILMLLLSLAAILGNQLNYFIGRLIGPKVFSAESSWFLNKKYLERTQLFYKKHGGKTIVLARFIPIVRSFAPFVAGISAMNAKHFIIYNLLGAVLWVGSLLALGFFLGSIPLIKNNFSLVIYTIIVLSLCLPFAHHVLRRFFPAKLFRPRSEKTTSS